jgi:hypothetical protein
VIRRFFDKNLRLTSGVLLFLLSFSASALDSGCEPYKALITIDQKVNDPFVMQDWVRNQSNIEESVAKQVVQIFLSGGEQSVGQASYCVHDYQESHRFLLTLQSTLIDFSLQKLRRAKSKSIRQFIALVDRRSNGGLDLTIRLTGHGFGPRPVNKKAGYHRADQTIFMDIEAIGVNEWLVILIHELSHYLDPQVFQSLKAFSDPLLVKSIVAASQRTNQLYELSSEERQNLDQWLMAGLNLGLLAEYRAWAVTALLYDEGLHEGLWQPIDWMVNFRSAIGRASDPWSGVLGYLDQHGLNPGHSLFSWALVQNALNEKRAALVAHPPDLGFFNVLF